VPQPGKKVKVPPSPSKPQPSAGKVTPRKRAAPEDDDIELLQPIKRARTAEANGGAGAAGGLQSPSKQQRLEEDGVVLLEKGDDDVDVIEID